MEGVALGISICALVISIIQPIFEYMWNKKINDKNLASDYFKTLFSDIMYTELPRAREYLHFDGNNITGTEQLEEVMRLLRQKLVYFKFSNNDFYQELLSEIQEFENYLISQSGKADSNSFAVFYGKVDEYIGRIHETINRRYLGKKSGKKSGKKK